MRLNTVGVCRVEYPDELILARQNTVVWHDIVMSLNQPAALFIDVLRLSNTQAMDVCDPTTGGPDPSRNARPISPLFVGLDYSVGKTAKQNPKT
jgi:hypothetical protein